MSHYYTNHLKNQNYHLFPKFIPLLHLYLSKKKPFFRKFISIEIIEHKSFTGKELGKWDILGSGPYFILNASPLIPRVYVEYYFYLF